MNITDEIFKKINKSKNDPRNYEYITLDNKLKVLLITDYTSTQCGALLNVNVGSIHDTYDGMAHFLEHMVFMGSEKYPNENDFLNSVSKYGGMTNAYTADTHTTYHFTIDSMSYLKILDMFSWFFMKPLLRKDGIEREVNAVDSEAVKNLLDDDWIFQEVIKKNMVNHPINHFTCGNKNTLKGDDLYEKVKEFFDNYYSSNIMHLILFINKDINKDILLKQVKDTFGKIENKNIVLDKNYGKMIIPKNIIEYIPNKDIDSLSICLQLPKITNDYNMSPYDFLNWILISKSDNSLFKVYEKNDYIINQEIGILYSYDDYKLLIFKIFLSKKATNNEAIIHIIEIFFDYISSIYKLFNTDIKKIEDIYNTLNIKYHRDFNIPDNENINDTINYFNELIIDGIDFKNLLDNNLYRPSFDKIQNNIKILLKEIKLHNSFIIYSSRNLKLVDPIIDDLYKFKYNVNQMPIIKLNDNVYDIIKKNKFIHNEVNIIDGEDCFPKSEPEIINKDYTLVYNFNNSFKIPYVNTYISIDLPNILNDPSTYMKCLLYLETIYNDNLTLINDLDAAEYKITFLLEQNLLYFYIKGDNTNIIDLCEIFVGMFKNKTGSTFNANKEKIYKAYNGFENEQPFKKINKLIFKTLLDKYFTPYELIKYMDCTFEECKKCYYDIIKNVILYIVVSGNIIRDDAIKVGDILYNNLKIYNKNDINLVNLKHFDSLPLIEKYKNRNINETNNIFTLTYEITRLPKNDNNYSLFIAFGTLLNTITNMTYFNSLRTIDQLGYIVNTKIIYIGTTGNKICGFRFLVQSHKQDSKFLFKRTKKFIKKELYTLIKNMTDDDLNDYKKGEISILSEKFNNLQEMDLYLCNNIFDGSFTFDFKDKLIESIEKINITDFTKMFEELILQSNKYYNISIDVKKKE